MYAAAGVLLRAPGNASHILVFMAQQFLVIACWHGSRYRDGANNQEAKKKLVASLFFGIGFSQQTGAGRAGRRAGGVRAGLAGAQE
eukprot:3420614-Pyramimonas_sp.AAC.1